MTSAEPARQTGGPAEVEPGAEDARSPAGALVECPECGAPATASAVETWGNCRACRTAQSRTTHPLRW